MILLKVKRRRLRALLGGAAMLGIGSASLSGTLTVLAASPPSAAPVRST